MCNSTQIRSGNPFNEKSFIVYRPQTSVLENVGQPKPGSCPITRPALTLKSFDQYEGLWFKRWRSRVSPTEPFFKCAYIQYIHEGNGNVFILDNLQNNVTDEWKRQNATSVLFASTPCSWTSTLSNGISFDTHLIYFDGQSGIALLYSCSNNKNGHNGIGNIYTRSPYTPLTKSYLNHLYDVYHQNGIYDVLPLHEVRQDNCDLRQNFGINNHAINANTKITRYSNEPLVKNVYND